MDNNNTWRMLISLTSSACFFSRRSTKTKEKRKTKVLLVALLLLAGFGYVREESFDVKEVHSSTTFYSIERIVWYFCVF
jgi:hypothetical protein